MRSTLSCSCHRSGNSLHPQTSTTSRSGAGALLDRRRKLINIKLINMGPLFRDTPRSIYINSTLAPRCDPAHHARMRILV